MTRIEPKHYDKIKKSMPLPCVDLLITQQRTRKSSMERFPDKDGDLEPPPHRTTILRGGSTNIK